MEREHMNANDADEEMINNLDLLINLDLLQSERDWDLLDDLEFHSSESRSKEEEP